MAKKHIFTDTEKIQIVSDYYERNLSSKKIAEKHNVSLWTILRFLKKNGYEIKNVSDSHKKYTINENYFNNINSEGKAYYLGLLFADGYNNTEKFDVSITLIPEDIDILISLNKELETNKPLRKDRKYIKLSIENKKISKTLNNLGCMKSKTHKIRFPNIPNEYVRHFIRGYFDGDGCITWSKNKLIPQFSIVGNEPFLIELQKELINNLGLKKTKFIKRHKNRKNNITSLIYGSYGNCIKIYEYLYEDSKFYLKRKKNKFIEIFNILNINYES